MIMIPDLVMKFVEKGCSILFYYEPMKHLITVLPRLPCELPQRTDEQ